MEIKKTTFSPQSYVGIKKITTFDEMRDAKTYEMVYGEIMAYLGKNNIKCTGAPVNIYYTWDEEKQETMMAIAMPVNDVDSVNNDELELMHIEESATLVATHVGDYVSLKDSHEAVEKNMKENGLELGEYVIEEYLTNPRVESDKSKWLTNIYYLVK